VDADSDGTTNIGDETCYLDSLIKEMGEEVKKWELFFNARRRC
jgi:hypothetical protein